MGKIGKIEKFLSEVKTYFSREQVSTNPTVLENHSKDESYHHPRLPEAVIFPENTDQVVEIVKLADQYNVPLIPFGMGTSLEGHIIPFEPSVTIDFSQMNQILDIHEQDLLVRVQPGVTRLQLEKELKKYGLFFPVDPGADATLGGMAATNASGTFTVRYGVMRDQIVDLEVVLPAGKIIHTGRRALKSSSGYHLNGLFAGSEGTLGIITELTLKVYGIPEKIMAARAGFRTLKDAVDAACNIIQAGIPVARVELVDAFSMKMANHYNETDYEEAPALFLEFHGNESGLGQDIQFAKEIAAEHHCLDFQFEKDQTGMNQLWKARHQLVSAFAHGFPGRRLMITDVCVPISRLAKAVETARIAVDAENLPAGIAGHVGDGNFHVFMMIDRDDPQELERAAMVNKQIVEYALACGGTCTGEHGVGIGKKEYQEKEHGEAFQIMKQIKSLIDPKNLFNPQKIF